jgi:alkylation response protein AidB-like acyl-CoA dehydrogenase
MAKLVFTEEETMLADSARGFLDSSAPVSHLRTLRDAGKTHDAALWAEMAQMGWAGILVPEEAGGHSGQRNGQNPRDLPLHLNRRHGRNGPAQRWHSDAS